jgi:hypothetical protein
MLCEYKDLFGKPNEGFHKTRLFGLAAYDLIGTIILIIVISVLSGINILSVALFVSVLTILMHRVFCVNTTLNKKIFGIV